MKYTLWVKIYLILVIFTIGSIIIFNYIIDPYGIYNSKIYSFNKVKKNRTTRLIKAMNTIEIKPRSICLGTSRASRAFDCNHNYFLKPSYNLAIESGSMYESKLYFKLALKAGHLNQVLLVLDYRMFKDNQKEVKEFNSYFNNKTKNSYLPSYYTLLNSITVIKNSIHILDKKVKKIIKKKKNPSMLEYMTMIESTYYKNYPNEYVYSDTKKESFPDFETIVSLCYQNNIELEIVFGPSHIRQWEALDYYIGYEKWLTWKKDIVLSVSKIANSFMEKPYNIIDFSVYHNLTSEMVPVEKDAQMKYYQDSSHYKKILGSIVLDVLTKESDIDNFGVLLNKNNIDQHLKHQKKNRKDYINISQYRIDLKKYIIKESK